MLLDQLILFSWRPVHKVLNIADAQSTKHGLQEEKKAKSFSIASQNLCTFSPQRSKKPARTLCMILKGGKKDNISSVFRIFCTQKVRVILAKSFHTWACCLRLISFTVADRFCSSYKMCQDFARFSIQQNKKANCIICRCKQTIWNYGL